MRYQFNPTHLLTFGVALTLALLGGLELLPARTLALTAPGAVENLYLQTPADTPGEPPVQWRDAKQFHWRCHYVTFEKYQPCGPDLCADGRETPAAAWT